MKHTAIISFVILSTAIAYAAGTNYLWGEIAPTDVLIAKENVFKAALVGVSVTKKYVFKQKDNLDAYTITGIKVVDKKKKNGATAELISGGPGSKGVTMIFKSKRGSSIKSAVEIYAQDFKSHNI